MVDVRFLGHHPMSSSIFCILVNATGSMTHSRNVVFNKTLPVPHPQPMSSRKLFNPSQFSHTDLGHHSSLTPSLHLMTGGESNVSLDDVSAFAVFYVLKTYAFSLPMPSS